MKHFKLIVKVVVIVLLIILAFQFLSSDNPSTAKLPITLDSDAFGLPTQAEPSLQIVAHAGYCLGYSETHEQAAWVCYELNKWEVQTSSFKRTDNFRPDPDITTESSQLVDFKGSGFDRGHLVPAGDMGWSYESMSQSFLLSNISPQQPGFNRGIWNI